MEERQSNYTIMEGYELPSGGLIYDTPINPHVELRSMTARDEMKRLSPSSTPLKTLSDIIEGCMIEKPAIHVYDMALGDYEFLLNKLRIVTYGPAYKINIQCSECGEYIETEADLETLQLKEIDLDEFNNIRQFTLPSTKDMISLKVVSPRLLEMVDAKAKEMKRKYKGADFDFTTFCKLTCCIETINEEKLVGLALEDKLNKLPAIDMQKILNQIDKISGTFGLDSKLYVTCPHCGENVLTFFRYGPEFFRPTTI